MIAVIGAQGIHLLSMHSQLRQGGWEIQPVSLVNWSYLFLIAFSVLVTMEAFKHFQAVRYSDM